MKKIKEFFKLNKAFTLAEMLCALGVSAIVILTVYTMMLSAQQTFSRLSDASKNTNNFRFLVNALRDSMQGAPEITHNSASTAFLTIPVYRNSTTPVNDIYFVSNVDAISNDAAKAKDIFSAPQPGNNSYNLYKNDNGNTILALSNVKKIYYSVEKNDADTKGGYQKLNIGIIYDEVLSDKKIDTVRQKRKMLCFTSKGR
ncbi:MAG: type II secretion system protein [Elusimicrobia bacterium]|nr:type II secretion system protein [Elusimicrobiota bacterium]